jgi:hypothetical protein
VGLPLELVQEVGGRWTARPKIIDATLASGGLDMPLLVNGYSLKWSLLNKTVSVYLHFTDNEQIEIQVSSPQELAAIADILRNSPNMGYEKNGEVLETVIKAPGS